MVDQQEDIYLIKMSGEPVEAVLVEKEEEMVYNGAFARADMRLWPKLIPKRSFDVIPRVFVDDWSGMKISLANSIDKIETLRFPKILDTEFYAEHLHVFRVPRLNVKITYDVMKEIEIYNYTIKFDREVISFKIKADGGRAELILNHNDRNVLATIKYRSCKEWKAQLESYKLYMITHRRPDWAED